MSAEPVKSPIPICEACYIKEKAEWEPQSIDDHGNILMKFKGIPSPKRYNFDSVETCEQCGSLTISGIFKFVDPDVVFDDEEIF